MPRAIVIPLLAACAACAPPRPAVTPAALPAHGTLSELSAVADADTRFCVHAVPEPVCTRCHPELAAQFQKADDWCGEHAVPESQCLLCHPDLKFTPLPPLPDGADVADLARAGEDVPSLAPHAPAGKVTVFDFHAPWCAPCRTVDEHVRDLLRKRAATGQLASIAYRRLNVVSWETPLARRYLGDVPKLPFVVVYDRRGRPAGRIAGLDLDALDRLVAGAEAESPR